MRQLIITLVVSCLLAPALSAQSYQDLCQAGEELYEAENYAASLEKYQAAFEIGEAKAGDLYNAACSAALAEQPGPALNLLESARQAGWSNVRHLKKDTDLSSLHEYAKWQIIVDRMQADLDAIEANYDKELQAELLDIYQSDQSIRRTYVAKYNELGRDHPEVDSLLQIMAQKDSVNLERMTAILDEHGWVSRDLVGGQAAHAQFLVIQHAPLEVQQKYRPLMQEAVDRGDLGKRSFALFLDRVALREGNHQVYGSQIGTHQETGEHYVMPLEDPLNVDVRRAEMGLPPLAEYVERWDIEWHPEEYRKNLPKYEKWYFEQ